MWYMIKDSCQHQGIKKTNAEGIALRTQLKSTRLIFTCQKFSLNGFHAKLLFILPISLILQHVFRLDLYPPKGTNWWFQIGTPGISVLLTIPIGFSFICRKISGKYMYNACRCLGCLHHLTSCILTVMEWFSNNACYTYTYPCWRTAHVRSILNSTNLPGWKLASLHVPRICH